MDSLSEMLEFLDLHARLDLKAVSVTHVLSKTDLFLQQVPTILSQIIYIILCCFSIIPDLTGTPEGRVLIIKSPKIIKNLFELTTDTTEAIVKDALRAIVNISADADGSVVLLCEVCIHLRFPILHKV